MSTMAKTVSNIGNEIFQIFENIVHGIAMQTKNTRDLVKLVFLVFFVVDVLTLGALGIINYMVTMGKEILAVVSAELSTNGYELLILAFLVLLYFSDKKKRR